MQLCLLQVLIAKGKMVVEAKAGRLYETDYIRSWSCDRKQQFHYAKSSDS